MSRTTTALCLGLLLFSAACGGDDPAGPGDNPGTGSFQVTVTGALTSSFSGIATFTSIADDVFGLGLYTSATTGQQYVLLNRDDAGRPGTGTYPIGDGTGAQFFGLASVQGSGVIATSGTLTITQSSASEIRGQLAFEGAVSGQGGTVNVTATFTATCPIPTGCG